MRLISYALPRFLPLSLLGSKPGFLGKRSCYSEICAMLLRSSILSKVELSECSECECRAPARHITCLPVED